MGLPHKFDDKDCPLCGVRIKKGDLVNKIESTGKWCSNDNCPNTPVEGQSKTTSSQPTSVPFKGSTDIEKLDFAETAVSRFISACKEGDLDVTKVAEQLGAVWNTALMNKK